MKDNLEKLFSLLGKLSGEPEIGGVRRQGISMTDLIDGIADKLEAQGKPFDRKGTHELAASLAKQANWSWDLISVRKRPIASGAQLEFSAAAGGSLQTAFDLVMAHPGENFQCVLGLVLDSPEVYIEVVEWPHQYPSELKVSIDEKPMGRLRKKGERLSVCFERDIDFVPSVANIGDWLRQRQLIIR